MTRMTAGVNAPLATEKKIAKQMSNRSCGVEYLKSSLIVMACFETAGAGVSLGWSLPLLLLTCVSVPFGAAEVASSAALAADARRDSTLGTTEAFPPESMISTSSLLRGISAATGEVTGADIALKEQEEVSFCPFATFLFDNQMKKKETQRRGYSMGRKQAER